MRNNIHLILIILLVLTSKYSFAQNRINSAAKEVVLYPQGAQVTRIAKVD